MNFSDLGKFIAASFSSVSNGNANVTLVLVVAIIGVTVLGSLHDLNSYAVTAIFSGIIGAAVGHKSGSTVGRLQAENQHLKEAVANNVGEGHN